MSDLRNRPNGTYIFDADWQDLYVLTEHWKSDLLFYQDDLKFLDHLIDKYFIWLSKEENIVKVREIELSLVKITKQCSNLLEKVNKHLSHLAGLIDDPFKYDSHQFRTEHQTLEDDISKFIKDFRKNRKNIFTITEHVIESEEMVRQLNS
ncbi:hypothetical protein BX611_0059 [Lutibacter oceani]|uniref:Uncharacterized protein n=1 Tax=Lutibacter oceani TaxID=1853311 RepID=A0A3D9RS49_9FLAO|nr:hypothetical protein [Lutibacter oceani]REE82789.1 hypothetical protein BX611_0059 [Lutibacter oceani]